MGPLVFFSFFLLKERSWTWRIQGLNFGYIPSPLAVLVAAPGDTAGRSEGKSEKEGGQKIQDECSGQWRGKDVRARTKEEVRSLRSLSRRFGEKDIKDEGRCWQEVAEAVVAMAEIAEGWETLDKMRNENGAMLAVAWIDHLERQCCIANKWPNAACYKAALIEDMMVLRLKEKLKEPFPTAFPCLFRILSSTSAMLPP
ncbi:hypothetical protein CHARACLAT_003537 [Characodon lateralis]|uniref:Uncharacterized protein n=1 Tax=Characodon lateralis TaxID=208331 RepID=A0ABU7DE02_9TELE|nr:hypothetical protein [Characodon lateralis]